MSTLGASRVDERAARSALVVAHPGHELLLHHWIERERPVVFALTDGSGSAGRDRSATSRRIIRAAGGQVGAVFAVMPDRDWYAAILAGRHELFLATAQRIAQACIVDGVIRVVADPVEYFNPLHDLCGALAGRVARILALERAMPVELLDYPIERPDLKREAPTCVVRLDGDALARKLAASEAYQELRHEIVRARGAGDAMTHAVERLFRADPMAEWPTVAPEEPFYERFGRARVATGTYAQLISYREHVLPLLRQLAAAPGAPRPDGRRSCAS